MTIDALGIWQIIALLGLAGGMGFVELASHPDGPTSANAVTMNHQLGILAVLASSMLSGGAGVYSEMILKDKRPVSLLIRNIQLSLYGSFLSLGVVFLANWSVVRDGDFFRGYTPLSWAIICGQAGGGLLISFIMRYADNILKGFATSLSLVIVPLISWVVFKTTISKNFVMGTAVVISSCILFALQSQEQEQDKEHVYETVAAVDNIQVAPDNALQSQEQGQEQDKEHVHETVVAVDNVQIAPDKKSPKARFGPLEHERSSV